MDANQLIDNYKSEISKVIKGKLIGDFKVGKIIVKPIRSIL